MVVAYDTLTNNILGNGGFFLKVEENKVANLYCPSGISNNHDDNTNIGSMSVLQLGVIEVYDVVFGNIEGDNNCNSSYGYNEVRSMCQHTSNCEFTANTATLGNLDCDKTDDLDIELTVIYGCPDQLDVFNLGCYNINFLDIINNNWYQDYVDDYNILNDGWEKRNNGIAKCAKIANNKGYPGFAIYNNGMCLMASNLLNNGVFNKYGVTDLCPINGLGNDISMNIYAFATSGIAYDDLGCINKTQFNTYQNDLESSFINLEGEHYLFQDSYKNRKNAISKCSQVASQNEYNGFALTDGGKCVFSNQFTDKIIKNIRDLTDPNFDNNTIYSCGKGTINSYQTFQFPYIDRNKESENGLTAGQIAAIVIVPLIVIGLAVIGFLLFKKYKSNGGNFNFNKTKNKKTTKKNKTTKKTNKSTNH